MKAVAPVEGEMDSKPRDNQTPSRGLRELRMTDKRRAGKIEGLSPQDPRTSRGSKSSIRKLMQAEDALFFH